MRHSEEDRLRRLHTLRNIAAARGGECLATCYTNNRTKLPWRCAAGHEWDAIPGNIVRGHWCMICGNERQGRAKAHSIDLMRQIAASRGGECLSNVYKNNLTSLRWRCAHGHEWNAVGGSVIGSGKRKGSWCPMCAGKLPKDVALENLKQLAAVRRGALLSSEYRGGRKALRWRCENGHKWEAVPDAVKHGTWCPVCGGSFRLTLAKTQAVAANHAGQCLSTEYINSKTHLRWRCENGHEWNAKPDHILADHWCPVCAVGISERICRAMLERMTGVPFLKARPSWLQTKRGKTMELDGYAVCLGLAFEYQGEQHYRYSGFFHATPKQFRQRQKYDRLKRRICRRRGITLVEIPYHIAFPQLQAYLIEQLDQKGSGAICDRKPIDIRELRLRQPKALDGLRVLAVSRGGILLSDSYIDAATKLAWRCRDGHEWQATAASVRRGSWCGICGDKRAAIKRAHTIEHMKALAARRGGMCLSQSYTNVKSRLYWRCAKNHEWETQASVILGGHWCPKCQNQHLARLFALTVGDVRTTAGTRGGLCLSAEYLNTREKLTWQCAIGHVWKANANSVRRGSWCPYCARRGSQRRLSAITAPDCSAES
jgi:hypothetical protein